MLTAIPSSGYQFSNWSGGASGSTNPLTLAMNANTSVTANFTAISITNLTITYPTDPNGQILVNFSCNQALTKGNVLVQVAVSQVGPCGIHYQAIMHLLRRAIICTRCHSRLTAIPLMC